jgi:hypothetical protein
MRQGRRRAWARGVVHGQCINIASSTWRAANGARWATFLGYFWAELANGPKTKFDAHVKLSYFHLATQVIRAID